MNKHPYDTAKACCLFDYDAPIHDMTEANVSDPYPADSLNFDELREANVKRCTRDFPGNHLVKWSANDWMTALVGEVGELANILKKIHRGYDLTKGMDEATLRKEAAKELGDIQCYLDLLAEKLGVDLGEATREKFNEVSVRVKSNITL